MARQGRVWFGVVSLGVVRFGSVWWDAVGLGRENEKSFRNW